VTQFIAQFHPLVVHLPIGMMLMAILLKVWSRRSNGSTFEKVIPLVVGTTLVVSIASVLSGYFLSQSGGYPETLLSNHKWSGFGFTILVGFLFWTITRQYKNAVQHLAWVASTLGLFITGHLGGSLTHGDDYLNFSFKKYQPPLVTNVDSALVYHDIIEPILAEKCWSCHSAVKKKGALRLDGIDHILQGGKHGDILSSLPELSKMYHRITLPTSDEDHMPPSGKPQPTPEEIKLIEWWLQNDPTQDKLVLQASTSPEIRYILEEFTEGSKEQAPALLPEMVIRAADPHVLKSLDSIGILVLPIAQNTNYLNVILNRATLKTSDWMLLKKIAPNIAWLSAKNTQLNDTTLEVIAGLVHLIKLDLTGTSLDDTNISKLASLAQLRSLNLTGTSVSEKGLTSLTALNSLEVIYLFQSKVMPASWSLIQKSFPHARLDSGHYIVPIFHGDTTEYTLDQLAIDKKDKELHIN